MESKKNIKINKAKSWFFEKINKIDKPQIRLIKKKRERTQISKIRNERREVKTDTKKYKILQENNYKKIISQQIGWYGRNK